MLTVLYCPALLLYCLPCPCPTSLPALPCELRPEPPPVYGEIEFDCGHWGVFENAIDIAHIHCLHADSFGNR